MDGLAGSSMPEHPPSPKSMEVAGTTGPPARRFELSGTGRAKKPIGRAARLTRLCPSRKAS